MRKEIVMSNAPGQNEEQVEGRSKIRTALVWLAVLVVAVLPFPWWP
jgi:hypothetical protein